MSPTDDNLRPPPSRSTTHSRPRAARFASTSSVASYLPQGSDLLLPEGSVSEETVGLLHDFVRHRNRSKARLQTEDTLVAEDLESRPGGQAAPKAAPGDEDAEADEEEEDWEAMQKRPWYRRPSPMWVLCSMPFSAIAMSGSAAPRIEILTMLACKQHKPETEVAWSGNTNLAFEAAEFHTPDYDSLRHSDAGLVSQANSSNYQEIAFVSDETMEECAKDPVVQAAVAKLMATLTTTMGILGCLTTAFWGSLSDRYGRLRVLGISIVGLLLTDVSFILVYYFSEVLPGGYWFLLIGPIVEGCLGGLTCAIAAMHAYVADCTRPDQRSRIFSLSLGVLFVGVAFGPTFGALLIRFTQSVMSVFYMGTAVHFLFALAIWFVVPESLSRRTRAANRARRIAANAEARSAMLKAVGEAEESGRSPWRVKALYRSKDALVFLSPLSIFVPVRVRANGSAGKTRLDWSLTLIAGAFGFATLIIGSVAYKFQYAAATFNWTSEELGYWLSLVGASRAFYLTLVLPLLIKFLNRPKQPIALPVEPAEPLQNLSGPSTSQNDTDADADIDTSTPTKHTHGGPAGLAPHSPAFDLGLARASLVLESACYAALALVPTPTAFYALSVLVSFGGGFGPAVQALALELYTRRQRALARAEGRGDGAMGKGQEQGQETGRLFGAISVVQAVGQQIIGPALFGLTYMKTVATYPGAIFWLSFTCIVCSLVCMSLVRLPAEDTAVAVVVPRGSDSGASESESDATGSARERNREATLVADA